MRTTPRVRNETVRFNCSWLRGLIADEKTIAWKKEKLTLYVSKPVPPSALPKFLNELPFLLLSVSYFRRSMDETLKSEEILGKWALSRYDVSERASFFFFLFSTSGDRWTKLWNQRKFWGSELCLAMISEWASFFSSSCLLVFLFLEIDGRNLEVRGNFAEVIVHLATMFLDELPSSSSVSYFRWSVDGTLKF